MRCEIFRPDHPAANRVGVVVLAGSSGRLDLHRSSLFAEHGAVAIALGYFGGPDEVPGICEVPLETLTAGIDALVDEGCRRVGLVGVSKGAEAALLVATLDRRVDAVVAFAPSSVVWANVGPGRDGRDRPLRSSWTWRGDPLPFVPYDDDWRPASPTRPAFRGHYEQSLVRFPHRVPGAAIRIEHASAHVILVAGGDDHVWPSDRFASEIAERAAERGGHVEVIFEPGAGHRAVLPGEQPPPDGRPIARGGTPEADARLGTLAWPAIAQVLGLH